ncbi:MAG TPA: SpoIIE family protein phosphatase [Actinomycetota bacterium]|nr:SpoIIE family protein phosphatase [Actinomycetota bacterium]
MSRRVVPPATRRRRRRPVPGPLAPWIWNPRWIPGFVVLQLAAMLAFAERSPLSFSGVPGGLGVLISVGAAIACGPLAGALVATAGGGLFVALVTDFEAGSQLAVLLWIGSAVVAGVISGRLRTSDRARAAATARERLAAARLHRLQSVTGALAGAMTREDVARVTTTAAITGLGADDAGLTIRTDDDPNVLQVLTGSAIDDPIGTAWRSQPLDAPAPASEIVATGRPVFIETRKELLARFPITTRTEGDERLGAFAGVPVTLGTDVLGALTLGFHREHMVPPEERGLLVAIARQAAVALNRIGAQAEERRARAAAEEAQDRLRKLQSVSDAANASPGLDDMLANVLPQVRAAVQADGTSLLLLSHDRRELHALAAEGLEERGGEPTAVPAGAGASGRIAATGRALVIDELTDDDVISPALRDRRSYVGVPVRVGGRVAGVLHASAFRPAAFDQADADFLQSIADSLALAIDRIRLFEQRDRMASALERALLPMSLPTIPGFEVATAYRPSHFGNEVGGDFYDVFGDGAVWYLAIGDVCGKGPEAAAVMGMTRIALRSLAREDDARPLVEVLSLLNGFLLESELMGERFCTVCLVRLELHGSRTRVTTCLGGHPPPLALRRDGTLEPIGRPGSLLGLLDRVSLHETEAELSPGDSLVLFTDGVTEGSSERPAEGELLFRAALTEVADEDAASIVKSVERSVLDPRGELRDDAALVVATRRG